MKPRAARSDCIRIRLHPEEKELLRFNASIQGMCIADYIRQKTLHFRLRQSATEKARLRQLARIGINLNQIARWANSHKRTVETVEILSALACLERQIRAFSSAEEEEDKTCS
ncbi:MAG: plasmid mobilization relaxosome protein MobC [Desulfovibrio sp.]|nr:plasmid mobilization relaxosome protein MobC [Desulfovibrio sp.]